MTPFSCHISKLKNHVRFNVFYEKVRDVIFPLIQPKTAKTSFVFDLHIYFVIPVVLVVVLVVVVVVVVVVVNVVIDIFGVVWVVNIVVVVVM